MKIFLSYGHDQNAKVVKRIRRDLEKLKHEVWIDTEKIKAGANWRRAITEGILGSDWVLSFLSRHSTRQPGVCLDELAIALGIKGGIIQTILLEDESRVVPPVSISHIQWLDMHDWARHRDDPRDWRVWYAGKFAELERMLQGERLAQSAGEIDTLARQLKPVTVEADIGRLVTGFTGREWLAKKIDDWRASPGNARMLWLAGPPGSGKSAFAAWLAHRDLANIIGIQFCTYGLPDRSDPRRIIRSFAFQIATRLPDYRKVLLRLPEIEALDTKNAAELFRYLLVEPLRLLIDGGRPSCLMILDGLDEAASGGRNELARILARQADSLPHWIRLLVTSRPEPAVRQHFSALNPIELRADEQNNRDDLLAFVRQWLQERGASDAARDVLARRITERSDGNFQYARQFQQAVEQGLIDLADPDSFPRGLSALYLSYFERQFGDDIPGYQACQRPLLELACAAREAMPLALAREVLGWDDYRQDDALEPLGALFSSAQERLLPFHKSILDWLADPAQAGRNYRVSVRAGNEKLAAHLLERYRAGPERMSDYELGHLGAHLAEAGQTGLLCEVFADFALHWQRAQRGVFEHSLRELALMQQLSPASDDSLPALRFLSQFGSFILHQPRPADALAQESLKLPQAHPFFRAAQRLVDQGNYTGYWLALPAQPTQDGQENSLRVYRAHEAPVRACLVLDASRFLSWSDDGTAILWDVDSGCPLHTLIGHRSAVCGVFALPGARLLSWDRGGGLCAWDAQNGQLLWRHESNRSIDGACRLASGDIAIWDSQGLVHLHDAEGLRLLHAHQAPGSIGGLLELDAGRTLLWCRNGGFCILDAVWKSEITADREHASLSGRGALALANAEVLAWGDGTELAVWDSDTGAFKTALSGHGSLIVGAALLPEQDLLSWSMDGTLIEWCHATWTPRRRYVGHTFLALGALCLPGKRLASWSDDKTIRIWDRATGACLHVLEGHALAVSGVIPGDGGRLLSWSEDRTIRAWDPDSGKALGAWTGHRAVIAGLAPLPGNRLLSWSEDATLRLWDGLAPEEKLRKDAPLASFKFGVLNDDNSSYRCHLDGSISIHDARGGIVHCIGHRRLAGGVLADGTDRLLSWSDDGAIRAWKRDDGRPEWELSCHEDAVRGVIALRAGMFASWSADRRIAVFSTEGRLLALLPARHLGAVAGLMELEDGRLLSWGADGALLHWDWRSGEAWSFDEEHAAPILGVAMLSSGLLVSWSSDCSLRLWQPDEGKAVAVCRGHEGWVCGALELADGSLLSWSMDGTMRLWDGSSGAPLQVLQSHCGPVQSCTPTMEPGRFVSWDADGMCRIWDIRSGEELGRIAVPFHIAGERPYVVDSDAHLFTPRIMHGNRAIGVD